MTDKELLKECKNFIDNYAMWEERDYDGFNLANKIEKQLSIHDVGSTLPQWTDNDVDASYLIGCMNAGGLDSIPKEIERLKQLGLKPHEAVRKIRGKR